MKKVVLSVLCAVFSLALFSGLVWGLTALAARNSRLSTEREETEAETNLLVWMDNKDWADAVIQGFKAKYRDEFPSLKISYETVGNVDTRGKVSLDGPAGIGPDVFLMPHDHIGNAIIDNICLPFPRDKQAEYTEKLLEPSLKTCTADGTLYAVPISTENIALFYNKALLGAAPVPESFEELLAFAETWNVPAQNKYALRWSVDDSYGNYFFLTAFGMQLFGPNMDDFRTPNFDSEAAKKGVDFHTSLRKYYNVNTADATWDATVAAFQRGEVPFTITGPWAIADAKNNGVDFGITKLPTIQGNQPRCFSGNIIAAVSSYTKNPKAARAFVDFLVSPEGEKIQYDLTGKMAAYKDVSEIEGLRDDVLLKGIMEQAPYSDPMPIIPEVNQMWDAMKALFTFTWDGQLSTEEAQKKAMETYDTALMMAGKFRNQQ
ncbi:MAG: maltose ABC transporter substrate-binding protein [Treponema sp.]|jgi:arabinogalactan oligomer/maltooligosaccharide transport system substrate-binding protein|nr:maltose ABC transporter substrate-binding protein [Treponema sp.]